MKKLARVVAIVLGTAVALVVVLAIASRFADGPLVELLPGGPLRSGDWVDLAPDDWGFVAEEQIVELESDGRSRKTWILTEGGRAYVPASLSFPPLKRWHVRALEEPDAVVRIRGRRHAVRLQRIEDPALEARLRDQVGRKYGGPPGGGGAWFFRLDPRGR